MCVCVCGCASVCTCVSLGARACMCVSTKRKTLMTVIVLFSRFSLCHKVNDVVKATNKHSSIKHIFCHEKGMLVVTKVLS